MSFMPWQSLLSLTIPSFVRYTLHLLFCVELPVFYRTASTADEESYENNLEQQLEDELKLEELMKHRQEPDKSCMVSTKLSKEEVKL